MTRFCVNNMQKTEPTVFAEGLGVVIRERKNGKDESKISQQLGESGSL